MHDYSVKGHPKVKIIFLLAVISISIAPLMTKGLDYFLNQKLHFGVTFAISASLVFGILYFLFSKWIWKFRLFSYVFKFPNLNGKYEIEGTSLKNPTGHKKKWNGILTIEQKWDKILIVLRTNTSSSSSMSTYGDIEYIPKCGYKLKYNYMNIPDITQEELYSHEGCCEIEFAENILEARASYYNNGKERQSHGTMDLRRNVNV